MLRRYRGVCLGLVGLLLSFQVSAAVLRIATLSPDGSTWMQTLRSAAADIKQRTAGRVDFRFYTGGTMGNDRTVLSKIRLGELQGGALTASSLDAYVHDLDLYSLPMLFDNFAAVDRARKVMDPWLSRQLEDAGWVNFGFAEGGFAYMMSRQAPITSLDQLRLHKVWIPEGDRFSATALSAFHVTPVPLSLGDVLPGLQTGIIDVVACSPIGALALQWQTQVHQMTDLPMSYFTGVIVIAKRDFDRLSPADQVVVRSVMTQAFHTLDMHNRQDNLGAYQALVNQGMHVVHPDAAQQSQWKEASQQAVAVLQAQGLVTAAGLSRIRSALAAHP